MLTLVSQKRIDTDDEPAGAELDKPFEGSVDFTYRRAIQDMQLQPERTPCVSHAFYFGFSKWGGRINQHGDSG